MPLTNQDIEDFVQQYRPFLTKIVRKYANNVHTDEDLMQEGLATAIYAMPKYEDHRGSKSNFLITWFKGGVLNYLRDNDQNGNGTRSKKAPKETLYLSQKNKLGTPLVDFFADEDFGINPAAKDNFEGIEDAIVIEDAFSALDDREYKILRLRYWNDLSQRTVAQRMGISQMHVSRLERKALDKLKNELENHEHV